MIKYFLLWPLLVGAIEFPKGTTEFVEKMKSFAHIQHPFVSKITTALNNSKVAKELKEIFSPSSRLTLFKWSLVLVFFLSVLFCQIFFQMKGFKGKLINSFLTCVFILLTQVLMWFLYMPNTTSHFLRSVF